MLFNINNPQFWRSSGMREKDSQQIEVKMGNDGKLSLSDEIIEKLQLKQGTELKLKLGEDGLLLERADPLLQKVYVEPTSECNLSCRTCVRNSWEEETGRMSMEVYDKLIAGLEQFPSLKKMSFWGIGEPLVHPNIAEMIKKASQLGVQTQMITNALLLDEKMAEDLLAAGLSSIVISIDGTSAATQADIRSGAELELIKDNVKRLRELRDRKGLKNPEIGLEFVIMKQNVHELKNLRKLAFEMGASFIFLTNLLPYTKEMIDEVLYSFSISRSKPEERTEHRPEIYLPPTDLRQDTINNLIKVSGHASSISTPQVPFDQNRGYCKFIEEGSISVANDGKISPCIALMHSYTCYIRDRQKRIKRIKRYTVGDLEKNSVNDIWANDEFENFRKKVKEFAFSDCTQCAGCEMSKTNEEDCHGNDFPVCGDCLWAKGVVQCP